MVMEIRNYFDLLFHHYVDFVHVQYWFSDDDDDDDFLLHHHSLDQLDCSHRYNIAVNFLSMKRKKRKTNDQIRMIASYSTLTTRIIIERIETKLCRSWIRLFVTEIQWGKKSSCLPIAHDHCLLIQLNVVFFNKIRTPWTWCSKIWISGEFSHSW